MRCRIVRLAPTALVLLCVAALGGCARVPWTDLVEDGRRDTIESAYRDFAASQSRCTSGWDADAVVDWQSSLADYSFSAYLQALPPAYFKLVVANPLGQPLRILATDGGSYRSIDVMSRSSVYGSTRSWALRYDLPYTVVKRSWPDWLQGRPDGGRQRIITEVRQDGSDRGVWLTVADAELEPDAERGEIVEQDIVVLPAAAPMQDSAVDAENEPEPDYPVYEYLLVDGETGIVKQQIVVDEQEKPQATISYNSWQQIDTCLYPEEIVIDDLPYNATIGLRFSTIRQTTLTPEDFTIRIPPGFSRTMMP